MKDDLDAAKAAEQRARDAYFAACERTGRAKALLDRTKGGFLRQAAQRGLDEARRRQAQAWEACCGARA